VPALSHSIAAIAALGTAALALTACADSAHDPTNPLAVRDRAAVAGVASVTPTATAAFTWSPSQTIKGWGIYPAAGTGAFWNRPLIQDAVYAAGATLVREQVDPALYVSGTTMANMVINTSLLAGYVAKLQAAKAAGVTGYIMSIWSPPATMKTNHSILGTYNGVVGSLAPASEPAFVAFVVTVMRALNTSAVGAPIALSIQNEPQHVAPYGGATYTPAQWQQVIMDTRGALDYWGLRYITLFGPETGQYTPAVYYNYLTDAPGYLGGPDYPALTGYLDHAVGAYAFHTYAQCSLAATQAAMRSHPKEAWMTEFGLPLGTTELAWTLDMMSAMAAHVVIIPFSYWFWWESYAPSTTAPGYGNLIGGETTPILSKRYFALKKLWTTVRPGWHVQAMTTTDPDLQVGAGTQDQCTARVHLMSYVNAAGDSTVVQIVNVTSSTKQIQVAGLKGTAQHSFRTDAWNDMVAQTPTNIYHGYSTISVPANSVVLAIMN
jgi:O-glycosyl hydrolase